MVKYDVVLATFSKLASIGKDGMCVQVKERPFCFSPIILTIGDVYIRVYVIFIPVLNNILMLHV